MDDNNVVFDPSANNGGKEEQTPNLQNPAVSQQEAPSGQNPQELSLTPEEPAASSIPNASEIPDASSSIPQYETPVQTEQPIPQEGQAPPPPPPPIHHGIFGGVFKKVIIGFVVFIVILFGNILLLPKGSRSTKAHLVWWGLWEDAATVQPLIDDFHKTNPEITVEYIKQDPKLYREKLITRIKNGTGPDIYRYHNTWVPMLSDYLLPLSSDVISPTDFKKNFYPVMQNDLVKNGGIYGIPLGVDSLGLFVNSEILNQAGISPPQTWEDFVKDAKALTVKDNGKIKTAGAALGTYGNVTHAPDIISLLFIQQGVDINKFAKFPNDEKDALDFYTSFAKSDNDSNVWDSTLDESLLSFARGTLAMYIGYSWDIFRIQAINPNLPLKTYPVPQLVGGNATIASYWVEGISSKSKNQKAALLFMKYLSQKETAQKFYSTVAKTRAFGEPYARVDLKDSLKDNKILYPFVSQLDGAQSSIFASDTNDGEGGLNSLANTYLGNAVNSIVNDNSSTQSVVETLDSGVAQVLQKYGVQ